MTANHEIDLDQAARIFRSVFGTATSEARQNVVDAVDRYANELERECVEVTEAVETESFEFLNELALAFRRGEKNARPQHTPILEGVRAVLAHLQSTGRLIPRMDATDLALAETRAEVAGAVAKYPPFNSSHEGYAVLKEEVDELWDDVKANNVEHSIEEAVQVAAMAIRYITDMRATSSPVVPAPTETGPRYCSSCKLNVPPAPYCTNCGGDTIPRSPTETGLWQTWQEVPDQVAVIRDRDGDRWKRSDAGSGWKYFSRKTSEWADVGRPNSMYAPFVAAEEG